MSFWPISRKEGCSKENSEPNVDERRRLKRIGMLLTIICQSVEHNEPFRIMTENVNILGIKFISSIPLLTGEVLDMTILLHSSFSNIKVNGRIVWCKEKIMRGKAYFEGGIEFLSMTPPDRIIFQKFIDRFKYTDSDDLLWGQDVRDPHPGHRQSLT